MKEIVSSPSAFSPCRSDVCSTAFRRKFASIRLKPVLRTTVLKLALVLSLCYVMGNSLSMAQDASAAKPANDQTTRAQTAETKQTEAKQVDKQSDAKPPEPTMLNKGEVIFEKNFDDQKEIDGFMDLRKHTKGTVKDGVMVTIPPSVHGEAPKGAKFAKEEFVRSHFKLGGQDYIFSFRVKFLELDRKVKQEICFIDLGHRWIRLELTPEGSQLVFQNYILGKRGQKKVVVENESLKLNYGQWYSGTVEISGDETLFNVNGEMFHVKNDLVAKKRETALATRFCLDLRGVGYELDYAAAWKPNGFLDTWENQRAQRAKTKTQEH